MKRYLIFLMLLALPELSFGQVEIDSLKLPVTVTDSTLHIPTPTELNTLQDTTDYDSVWVHGRSILILGDSSIYIPRDTVLFMPDTLADQLQRDRTRRSEEFYSRLKERFYRTRFTRELYDLIFTQVDNPDESRDYDRPLKYREYAGQKINRIVIKNLDVLGTNIEDTSMAVDMWAINLANRLHISTRTTIIRNNLFFRRGDEVDPDLLYDSERILRSLPYIKDARIYIVEDTSSATGVVAHVIVKDVWSITGSVGFSSFDLFTTTLTDKNFMGWGHEFRNIISYNESADPQIGYEGTYTLTNISRSFVTGQISYANTEPFSRVGFKLSRGFITPEIEYAGGFEMATERRRIHQVYRDTTYTFYAEHNVQDLWFGRSFQLKDQFGRRNNLQMAARTSRVRYVESPEVSIDTNQLFYSHNLYLISVGLAGRSYEKNSLITGYGRTEDIPMGYLLETTIGTEVNDFYSRTYLGSRFSVGGYLGAFGYLRPRLRIGGFLRKGRIEQGVINPEFLYFSSLYRIRRMNLRHFIRMGYTKGFGRFEYEFVDINNRNGIRGLYDVFLRGTERISLKYEGVLFTPAYFLGFRMAVYAFADMALVNSVNSDLLRNNVYQGYGVGFRFRNENLVFKTMQIRFSWYPVTPSGLPHFGLELSDQAVLNLPDFRVERPSVLRFE